jgi:hypothetical protein
MVVHEGIIELATHHPQCSIDLGALEVKFNFGDKLFNYFFLAEIRDFVELKWL